jgi:hypothetical protein
VQRRIVAEAKPVAGTGANARREHAVIAVDIALHRDLALGVEDERDLVVGRGPDAEVRAVFSIHDQLRTDGSSSGHTHDGVKRCSRCAINHTKSGAGMAARSRA